MKKTLLLLFALLATLSAKAQSYNLVAPAQTPVARLFAVSWSTTAAYRTYDTIALYTSGGVWLTDRMTDGGAAGTMTFMALRTPDNTLVVKYLRSGDKGHSIDPSAVAAKWVRVTP